MHYSSKRDTPAKPDWLVGARFFVLPGLRSCAMTEVRKPLLIEIVAYAPTAYYHCTHCEVIWKETGFSEGLHEEQVKSALPPDLLNDYQAVSDWVRRLQKVHCDQVVVKVIDATSPAGVFGTNTTPTAGVDRARRGGGAA